MSLFIGRDRGNRTHLVRDGAQVKGCGYSVCLCGAEVMPTTEEATMADCFYCNHAVDLGIHLLDTKKPTQSQ
jgi:hypothetical protein